jgi:arabinofuranosyltransferase
MNIINRRTQIFVIIGICLAAVCGYIIAAGLNFRIGFPLDDAWIHQTFARNLIEYKEWSFNPGHPTAGSTSPLWTILLSGAYIFHISPLYWAYFLGGLFFITTCLLSNKIINQAYLVDKWLLTVFIFAIIPLEWHLVWAAASGMETILFTFFVIFVFYLLLRREIKPIIIGLIIGMAVWVRPEGITLLGPTGLIIIYQNYKNPKSLLTNLTKLIGSLIIILLPYLYFNYSLSGSIWPNTLLAKQIEYQNYLQINLIVRFVRLFAVILVGSNLFLLPGFIYGLYSALKTKNIFQISILLWFIGFILLYTSKLPVTYQHGRYLISIIPTYLFLALPGVFKLIEILNKRRVGWAIGQAWLLSSVLTSFGFYLLGAKAYSSDVSIIETEMVEPSRWIKINTPPDTVIAAHDIGALGYFGDRFVLDLAGLINKDVVPIVTNPEELTKYLKESNAEYLMIFPNWYSESIVSESLTIYKGKFTFASQAGGESMEVYQLKK